MKDAGSEPPSIEQKAQEGEGCTEEPWDQALPPPIQCSAPAV